MRKSDIHVGDILYEYNTAFSRPLLVIGWAEMATGEKDWTSITLPPETPDWIRDLRSTRVEQGFEKVRCSAIGSVPWKVTRTFPIVAYLDGFNALDAGTGAEPLIVGMPRFGVIANGRAVERLDIFGLYARTGKSMAFRYAAMLADDSKALPRFVAHRVRTFEIHNGSISQRGLISIDDLLMPEQVELLEVDRKEASALVRGTISREEAWHNCINISADPYDMIWRKIRNARRDALSHDWRDRAHSAINAVAHALDLDISKQDVHLDTDTVTLPYELLAALIAGDGAADRARAELTDLASIMRDITADVHGEMPIVTTS